MITAKPVTIAIILIATTATVFVAVFSATVYVNRQSQSQSQPAQLQSASPPAEQNQSTQSAQPQPQIPQIPIGPLTTTPEEDALQLERQFPRRYTSTGQIIIKGFYIGMPLSEAIAHARSLCGGNQGHREPNSKSNFNGVSFYIHNFDGVGLFLPYNTDNNTGKLQGFAIDRKMFNAAGLSEKQFAQLFCDSYHVEQMNYDGTSYVYASDDGYRVMVNALRVFVIPIPRASERRFD